MSIEEKINSKEELVKIIARRLEAGDVAMESLIRGYLEAKGECIAEFKNFKYVHTGNCTNIGKPIIRQSYDFSVVNELEPAKRFPAFITSFRVFFYDGYVGIPCTVKGTACDMITHEGAAAQEMFVNIGVDAILIHGTWWTKSTENSYKLWKFLSSQVDKDDNIHVEKVETVFQEYLNMKSA